MFQYNHNEHYANLLLRQVPSDCRSALDMGCGDGGFARHLADWFSAAYLLTDLFDVEKELTDDQGIFPLS
jgi:hypothetical protein